MFFPYDMTPAEMDEIRADMEAVEMMWDQDHPINSELRALADDIREQEYFN